MSGEEGRVVDLLERAEVRSRWVISREEEEQMNLEEPEDTTVYKVVVNHEEQHSIWPADRGNPPGWRDAGKQGSKAECLAYIEEVWTDMRPLSLRSVMEKAERAGLPQEPPAEDDLVRRLCEGEHPVIVSLQPAGSTQLLKERIDLGYVHIKFTGTRGGTELGVRLDPDACDLSAADFEHGSGTAHLVGRLILNDVPVRCVADLDLNTLAGHGHLKWIDE